MATCPPRAPIEVEWGVGNANQVEDTKGEDYKYGLEVAAGPSVVRSWGWNPSTALKCCFPRDPMAQLILSVGDDPTASEAGRISKHRRCFAAEGSESLRSRFKVPRCGVFVVDPGSQVPLPGLGNFPISRCLGNCSE